MTELKDAIKFTCLCGLQGYIFNECEPPALGHVPPLCKEFLDVESFKDAAEYLKRCRLSVAQ